MSNIPDVEITPTMLSAGVSELRERAFGQDLGEIAAAIYYAMEYERRDSTAPVPPQSSPPHKLLRETR